MTEIINTWSGKVKINLGKAKITSGTSKTTSGTGEITSGTGKIVLGTGQINLGKAKINSGTAKFGSAKRNSSLKIPVSVHTAVYQRWAARRSDSVVKSFNKE